MVFYGPQEALEFQNGEVLFKNLIACLCGPGKLSLFRDSLRTRRSGDQIPVGVRFSTRVHKGPGAHQASCTMGTVSLSWGESGLGVALTIHNPPSSRAEVKEGVELYFYTPSGTEWPVIG